VAQNDFDRLLAWLNPDPEMAGLRYEEIRARLIKILVRKGCYEAELVADESFDRVTKRLPEIQNGYVGDPALYFCGVARLVFKEWIKRKRNLPVPPPVPAPDPPDVIETRHRCLDECLDQLSHADYKIIVRYFRDAGRAKIDTHNAMAKELGISISALRTRACRVKKVVYECMIKCIKRSET
jgi:DNA-directed RNA polymerase specialized sigma24 family protein